MRRLGLSDCKLHANYFVIATNRFLYFLFFAFAILDNLRELVLQECKTEEITVVQMPLNFWANLLRITARIKNSRAGTTFAFSRVKKPK
jgi:hypothetical protein